MTNKKYNIYYFFVFICYQKILAMYIYIFIKIKNTNYIYINIYYLNLFGNIYILIDPN